MHPRVCYMPDKKLTKGVWNWMEFVCEQELHGSNNYLDWKMVPEPAVIERWWRAGRERWPRLYACPPSPPPCICRWWYCCSSEDLHEPPPITVCTKSINMFIWRSPTLHLTQKKIKICSWRINWSCLAHTLARLIDLLASIHLKIEHMEEKATWINFRKLRGNTTTDLN